MGEKIPDAGSDNKLAGKEELRKAKNKEKLKCKRVTKTSAHPLSMKIEAS